MEASSDVKVRAAHCETHGTYEEHRWQKNRWSTCPGCAKLGREREEAQRLEDERADFIRSATLECGLIGRFSDATFRSFNATNRDQRKAVTACQEYTAGVAPGIWSTLTLIGQPGTGKTHLGAAMVLETIERRKRAKYTTFRDLIRTLRATWRRDSDSTEDEVINEFAYVPLLVIDEIGVGFGTEAEAAQLFDVIDRRYQASNPLVLISNLSVPDLREALGDRLFDRIREASQVVPCNWPSHRGAASTPRSNTV